MLALKAFFSVFINLYHNANAIEHKLINESSRLRGLKICLLKVTSLKSLCTSEECAEGKKS